MTSAHGPRFRGHGRFVTFEGIEGCGKTTQLRRLADRLAGAEVAVVLTREPGGTALGRSLRSVLLAPDNASMAPATELLLYAADRAQHLIEVVEPALAAERVVLCDRYLDATLAYQGFGRELGVEAVLELHRRPPLDRRPDRTVLLDLDPAEALQRARRRNDELGVEASEGRFEQERLAFHRRVREGYLSLAAAEPERFAVIDARGAVAEVSSRVRAALRDLFPELEAR